MPKAVWRGSTGGFGGLEKGRAALLNLGQSRPDLIDSGVLDWDYERYGPDEGRLKDKMEFGHQVLLHPPRPWGRSGCVSSTLAAWALQA